MTSTTTGLPDRYRPLEQVGPDEPTATGVITCWRAKDRVLNRDVAVRVHTPAGPAAHAWIARALTAGGLANPALAMVYDASEGTGDPSVPGGAAYVVNEWIDGETLTERLARGPLGDREARTVLRRLADGVAEAHRVGLAVGGLTRDNVVLRPNGLVGLRAVPAATGTTDGDIAALGELLEDCLTGLATEGADAGALTGPPDLVALVHRARSTEPSQALASVAAMAALLAQAPRTSPSARTQPGGGEDAVRRRRARDRRPAAVVAPRTGAEAPVRLDPSVLPPVPAVRPITEAAAPLPAAATGGDTVSASGPPPGPSGRDRWRGDDGFEEDGPLPALHSGDDGDEDDETTGGRRLVVVGLSLLALVVVVALAWWFGSSVLSVAGSVDDNQGSTPSVSAGGADRPTDASGPAGPIAAIAGAEIFDPNGDGAPENDGQVPLTYDDDASTTWSTVEYRGSPAFGNLKDGVGIVYDLGDSKPLAGVTVASPTPGATVEIRTADRAGAALGDFDAAATGTLADSTDLTFEAPVTARYVLVWITGLVEGADGFSASLAEVVVHTGG